MKNRPRTLPGTISAATPEAAGRFLDAMLEARRKWWEEREMRELAEQNTAKKQSELFERSNK